MYDVALKYFNVGLSVVALKETKQPMGHWKERETRLIAPTDIFKTAYGVGIICGKVSGGVECIDIDCKYDITGRLMEDYCKYVNQRSRVLTKVVIEKTPSGGWHIVYKCSTISNNQKLAQRYATQSELEAHPEAKVRVLFETRGEGGYFMCAPTPKYEITYGDMLGIPEITVEERRALLDTARTFNEVFQSENRNNTYYGKENPFAEYDETADVVGLLQEYGWTLTGESSGNVMLKRPGETESVTSGGYHPVKKIWHVFTTSTMFSPAKGYSPSGVLCMLKFNGDWRACAKWLYDMNYGKTEKNKTEGKSEYELFSSVADGYNYFKQVREGTLPMGLSTGFTRLDEYWRLKESHLVVVNGVDNVGKSQVMWYLYMVAAVTHGWNFLIYAGENPNPASVYRKLMEFYICKPLIEMATEEYEKAKHFVDSHFMLLKNKSIFTVKDMIDYGTKALQRKKYNVFLIDPYNSLYRDKSAGMNPHDYDYEALGNIRQWITDTTCSCHIICHSATEALRKYYPKDHPLYANLVMPPNKGDTEGGGKFSNRADDFLTIHRHAQSKDQWMWTEIYNRKNRDNDTGGKQTPYDKPFKMMMINDRTGFQDENGYNPILKTKTEPVKKEEPIINYHEPANEPYPF